MKTDENLTSLTGRANLGIMQTDIICEGPVLAGILQKLQDFVACRGDNISRPVIFCRKREENRCTKRKGQELHSHGREKEHFNVRRS